MRQRYHHCDGRPEHTGARLSMADVGHAPGTCSRVRPGPVCRADRALGLVRAAATSTSTKGRSRHARRSRELCTGHDKAPRRGSGVDRLQRHVRQEFERMQEVVADWVDEHPIEGKLFVRPTARADLAALVSPETARRPQGRRQHGGNLARHGRSDDDSHRADAPRGALAGGVPSASAVRGAVHGRIDSMVRFDERDDRVPRHVRRDALRANPRAA